MKSTVDDFLTYIRSAGFSLKEVGRSKRGQVRVLLENPRDTAAFKSKFLGRKVYRDLFGRDFQGIVTRVSGRLYDITIAP